MGPAWAEVLSLSPRHRLLLFQLSLAKNQLRHISVWSVLCKEKEMPMHSLKVSSHWWWGKTSGNSRALSFSRTTGPSGTSHWGPFCPYIPTVQPQTLPAGRGKNQVAERELAGMWRVIRASLGGRHSKVMRIYCVWSGLKKKTRSLKQEVLKKKQFGVSL